MFALAVHWWNPLVWLMHRAATTDREIACDEWVRRKWADVEEYGKTLITIARWLKGGSLPGAALMATGKEQIQGRVEAMTRGGVVSAWRGAVLAILMLPGVIAVTAKAEQKVRRPARDWTSEKERQAFREEKGSEYREILRYGGLEVESRFYEISSATVPKLSRDVFGSATPTVVGITTDQVRLLDRSKWVESSVTMSGIPLTERLNRRTQAARAWNSEIARMEIIRNFRYFNEYGRQEGKIIPLKSQSTPLGLCVGVKNWQHFGDLLEFGVTIELRELIGWHHFLDPKLPYRQVPWKKGLLHRQSEVPKDPSDFATPIFATFRIETSTSIFSQVPNYVLFRLKPFSTIVSPNGEQRDYAQDESPFPHHPIYDQEYWVVVRVEYIPPEKPASP